MNASPMKWIRMLPWIVANWLTGTVSASEPAASTAIDPDRARAQAAMADLGQSLRSALQQKIAQDGIVAAISFCHDQAPRIAAEVSKKHGVAVGRTSLKHRNPANAPTPWQRAVLDDFAARVAKGEAVADLEVSVRDGAVLRVAKGLRVDAPCLVCHGPTDQIAPAVAQALSAQYPDDQATGFREGDLRGLIWAEVPLDADVRTPNR